MSGGFRQPLKRDTIIHKFPLPSFCVCSATFHHLPNPSVGKSEHCKKKKRIFRARASTEPRLLRPQLLWSMFVRASTYFHKRKSLACNHPRTNTQELLVAHNRSDWWVVFPVREGVHKWRDIVSFFVIVGPDFPDCAWSNPLSVSFEVKLVKLSTTWFLGRPLREGNRTFREGITTPPTTMSHDLRSVQSLSPSVMRTDLQSIVSRED